MTVERWKCTSYCRCGSRRGHFEKADAGIWVLNEDHEADVAELRGTLSLAEEGLANYAQENELLKKRCEALALLLYPDPNNPADWDCCDEHETTFPKGGACPQCSVEPQSPVITEKT